MCTLTRVNNQRSKKLNICMSKMHIRLTFRWIIQNIALLKHTFSSSVKILLLLNWRNFRVFCLNSTALKPTFHFVWEKSTIFCGINMKNMPKRSTFRGNAILENTKWFGKRLCLCKWTEPVVSSHFAWYTRHACNWTV